MEAAILCLSYLDILRDYSQAFFRPDRIVISAAGNLEHEAFVNLVAKEFGAIDGASNKRAKDNIKAVRESKTKNKSIEQVHFCIGAPAYSQHDDRKYILAIMDSILGGGMSSRLFQEIRENRGLAYAIGSYSASYNDTGLFAVYGGTSLENLDEVLELIRTECANLRDNNASDVEIERGKNQIRGALVLGQESMSNRMSRMSKSELYFGRVISTQEIVERIMRVSKDDIAGVAHELFEAPEFTYAAVGPFDKNGGSGS